MKTSSFLRTHPVFRFEEFRAAHADRRPGTVHASLRYHAGRGNLLRVRRGIFATLPPGVPPDRAEVDPYLVATSLAEGGAVASHAALQFHGKAYSQWARFAFLTSRRALPFSFRSAEFVPVLAPRALRESADPWPGVETLRHAGGAVRVTTLERTLVDVLDAPEKAGGAEEVWRSLELVEYFRLDEVLDYAARLGSAVAAARVGHFLEAHREALMVEEQHLAGLQALRPRQPRYWDSRRAPGRFLARWNLVVPREILDRAWEEPA